MRTLVTLVTLGIALTACGGAPHPAAAPAPAPVAAAPAPAPTPPRAPALDEAAVKDKSHAFFDALDRMDIPAFTAQTAPAFIQFEDARFLDRAFFVKVLQGRLDRHAPARTREWRDEHVFAGPESIVFIGEAIEKIPGEGDRKPGQFDGYNTLVWVRDGDHWSVALWQWARAGVEAEKQRWNEVFKAAVGFKLEPNQLLVDTVKGKKPGKALDLAMGQGRNAIYLASQRWAVTGVDIADEGIKIAKQAAADRKLALTTVEADLDTWDLGKNQWDLVTMIYAGNDLKLVERIKPSLKKGGLFVTEYFARESEVAGTGAGGWDDAALTAAFKDGFDIVRNDVVDDISDYGLRKTKLVRFVARKR